jgi:hypothetical protein
MTAWKSLVQIDEESIQCLMMYPLISSQCGSEMSEMKVTAIDRGSTGTFQKNWPISE